MAIATVDPAVVLDPGFRRNERMGRQVIVPVTLGNRANQGTLARRAFTPYVQPIAIWFESDQAVTDRFRPTQLGHDASIPHSPEEARLERVANPHAGTLYLTRFTAPEFTSLCPVTGQPDFAHVVIDYAPDRWLVESKSLKLYLTSFRNHGAFHEDCTVRIGKDLVRLLEPTWLRIGGYWYPRGGMPIDVFWQTAVPPAGLWLPDPGVAPYRGRG